MEVPCHFRVGYYTYKLGAILLLFLRGSLFTSYLSFASYAHIDVQRYWQNKVSKRTEKVQIKVGDRGIEQCENMRDHLMFISAYMGQGKWQNEFCWEDSRDNIFTGSSYWSGQW